MCSLDSKSTGPSVTLFSAEGGLVFPEGEVSEFLDLCGGRISPSCKSGHSRYPSRQVMIGFLNSLNSSLSATAIVLLADVLQVRLLLQIFGDPPPSLFFPRTHE